MEKNTRLKGAIFEQNLTQRKLAAGTGIREEYISMSVNGRMLLTRDQRRKIAVFLRRPENELFQIETHVDTVAHELVAGTCG